MAHSKDLTLEQLAVAYRGYFKAVLKNYGGRAALNKLGDQKTAATFSDTLFMHGTRDGEDIVKFGIQDVIEKLTPEDRRKLGLRPLTDATKRPDTMDDLQRLDAAGHGPAVRDAITEQRLDYDKWSEGEERRIEHFRFPDRP